MSLSVAPGKQTFFHPLSGALLALGTVEMYIPSTLTPKSSWQDEAKTELNTNPITLDAAGQCIIWGDGLYRQILKDQAGNVLWDEVVGFGGMIDGSVSVGGDLTVAGAAKALRVEINGPRYQLVSDGATFAQITMDVTNGYYWRFDWFSQKLTWYAANVAAFSIDTNGNVRARGTITPSVTP